MMIKLAKWCERNGICYTTGLRWFKAGHISGACKSPSGTILVPDEQMDLPEHVNVVSDSKTMTLLLNKIVEFSSIKASIADFGAYIMANFQITPTVKSGPVIVSEADRKDEAQLYIKQWDPDPEKTAEIKKKWGALKRGKPAYYAEPAIDSAIKELGEERFERIMRGEEAEPENWSLGSEKEPTYIDGKEPYTPGSKDIEDAIDIIHKLKLHMADENAIADKFEADCSEISTYANGNIDIHAADRASIDCDGALDLNIGTSEIVMPPETTVDPAVIERAVPPTPRPKLGRKSRKNAKKE